jgi:hypothetical protein
MIMRYVALYTAAVLATVGLQATSVQALSMKECSAKYKAAKDAGTLNGMKWSDFRREQCGAESTAAPASVAPAPAPATTAKPAAAPARAPVNRQRHIPERRFVKIFK